MLAGPLDLTLTAVLAMRRFGFTRTLLGSFLLLPVYLYSLPPVPCSCIGPLFRRCDYGRPYRAAVMSDLKNLASQQEIYYSDHDTYSPDPVALGFTASTGVTVTIVTSRASWSARATHAALGEQVACTIWHGWDEAGDRLGEGVGASGEIVCPS